MKLKMRYVVLALILLFAAQYTAVVKINDRVAEELKNALTDYPLPAETELLDSIAIAGKVEGNGNGMQYCGAILVKTNLTEAQLEEHYASAVEASEGIAAFDRADCVIVSPQEVPELFEYQDYRFENFDASANCFRISLWIETVSGFEDTFLQGLLNTDLRGH